MAYYRGRSGRFVQVLAATVLACGVVGVRSQTATCQHGLTANDIAVSSGFDLTEKVALVTGGRSGLGYAISEALLRQNCTVVIASRDEPKNEEAVEKLRSAVPGAKVTYRIFDLEDFQNVRAFASDFLGNHTRLDYYFGNAGQGAYGVQPLTVDGYERIFQVNYLGQFLLLELLLPLLRQSQPARVLLTASSAHATACGSLNLTEGCYGDGSAISKLPFDQEGLDAVDNTFHCMPTYGTYSTTKALMMQLARELASREAAAGYQVYSYAWAPGNIHTDLNPFAMCCVGPIDGTGEMCPYQLPYVGPKDDEGKPDPPDVPVNNHWTSPAHGAMAGVFVALNAETTESGKFFATYWECQEDKGYFSHGITPEARSEIFELSKSWVGLASDEVESEPDGRNTTSGTIDVGLHLLIATVSLTLAAFGLQ